MQKIELPAWSPEMMKVSRWALGNMQFNVLLSNIAAINETLNAAAMLRERPDLYRHRTKQVLNIAMRQTETLKYIYMVYTNHPGVFDEFSDHIIDVTEEDVNRLRDLIRSELDAKAAGNAEFTEWLAYQGNGENSRSNAEIVAWTDTALMLLHLAAEHYSVVVNEANSRGQKAIIMSSLPQEVKRQEAHNLNYGSFFSGHNPHGLLARWQELHRQIDPVPDILTEKPVLDQLKLISQRYGQGDYLRQCLAEMKDDPLFASVVVNHEEENT